MAAGFGAGGDGEGDGFELAAALEDAELVDLGVTDVVVVGDELVVLDEVDLAFDSTDGFPGCSWDMGQRCMEAGMANN